MDYASHLQPQQLPCVSFPNLLAFSFRNRHLFDGVDCFANRPEAYFASKRHIRAKEDPVSPVIFVSAHQRSGIPMKGRVGIEHLEILRQGLLQPQLKTFLFTEHQIMHLDAVGEEGHSSPAVVGNEFDVGIKVEYPAVDQSNDGPAGGARKTENRAIHGPCRVFLPGEDTVAGELFFRLSDLADIARRRDESRSGNQAGPFSRRGA